MEPEPRTREVVVKVTLPLTTASYEEALQSFLSQMMGLRISEAHREEEKPSIKLVFSPKRTSVKQETPTGSKGKEELSPNSFREDILEFLQRTYQPNNPKSKMMTLNELVQAFKKDTGHEVTGKELQRTMSHYTSFVPEDEAFGLVGNEEYGGFFIVSKPPSRRVSSPRAPSPRTSLRVSNIPKLPPPMKRSSPKVPSPSLSSSESESEDYSSPESVEEEPYPVPPRKTSTVPSRRTSVGKPNVEEMTSSDEE